MKVYVRESLYRGAMQLHPIQLQRPCCVEETQLRLALLQTPDNTHTHTETESHPSPETNCTTNFYFVGGN